MSKFSCICPSEQKKRDIADKFPCICPTRKKKRDIANKFLYICLEREKKKIQSADFHTYANIQKAMCIKNPATAGGEIFLWRSRRVFKSSLDMSIHGHLVCDCLYKDFSVQIRRYPNIKISLSEQAS